MQAVKREIIRMSVVFAILIALTAWQFGFVVTAISANPALNFIIIGTFVFGLALVVSVVSNLRNEFRALYALMEMHEDTVHDDEMAEADPLWKFYRCNGVGIVFQKPKILGQSYQLINERLARDGRISISAGTMDTLSSGIDQRLSDSKSLIAYIAGTLIFLGLIGTFIGLMVTLASVGDILGSLDLSGDDPTETVAALMANLQTPLGGMATGFSSSLFGLLTSLTISIMMQMLSRAGRALKSDFSDWISNVVELSDGVDASQGGDVSGTVSDAGRSAAMEERRLALLMKTARHTVQSNQRQARAVRELTEEVKSLTIAQGQGQRSMDQVVDVVRVLAEQHKIMHGAFARSIDAVKAVASGQNVKREVAELTALMAVQLETRDSRLALAMEDIHSKLNALPTATTTSDDVMDREADSLSAALIEHTDELNVGQLNKLLDAVYRRELEDRTDVDDTPTADVPTKAGGQA